MMTSLLKNRRSFKPDFLRQVRRMYRVAEHARDLVIEQLAEEDKHYAEIDCKKGCFHCCGMIVKPTMPELYIIFEHIKSTYSAEALGELMKTLRKHADTCSRKMDIKDRLQVYCSFLENDVCSIHEVKPLSCRAYTSTDVEMCKNYLQEPTISIPNSICHYSPFDITRKAIMKSLYIAGFSDVTEELNSGILRLLIDEYREL